MKFLFNTFFFSVLFKGAVAKLRKRLVASSCLSVRPSAWNNLAPTGRIFVKFMRIFRKSAEKVQFLLKFDKNNGCTTQRPMNIYHNISLNCSYSEQRRFVKKKSKYIFYE